MIVFALILNLAAGLLADTAHARYLDGAPVDTLASSPAGVLVFDSPPGRIDLVPLGDVPIPPIDCPDLIPTAVHAEAPCGAGEWWARFQVRNQGRADAGPFSVRVSLTPPGGSRSTKCTLDLGGLAVAASQELACRLASSTPSTPVGNWSVWIQVDVGDQVGESDETNNEW